MMHGPVTGWRPRFPLLSAIGIDYRGAALPGFASLDRPASTALPPGQEAQCVAVYSEQHKFIFFANPQTASKAVAATMIEHLAGEHLHDRLKRKAVTSLGRRHHMTWEDVQTAGLMTAEEMVPLLKVTTIRNPYDLLVSRYLKRKERFNEEADDYPWVNREGKARIVRSMAAATELTFPEWLEKEFSKKRRENGNYGTAGGQAIFLNNADFVIRFEHLQADFDEFRVRIHVDRPITVAKKNVTTQRLDEGVEVEKKIHFTEFYDDASRSIVRQLYRPVIKRFNYKCE